MVSSLNTALGEWSDIRHRHSKDKDIRCQVVTLLLLLFLQSLQSALQCDFSRHHLQHRNLTSLKHQLQAQLRGRVLAPWDDRYEEFRKIHNAACCQKPLLIARPTNQKVKDFCFEERED